MRTFLRKEIFLRNPGKVLSLKSNIAWTAAGNIIYVGTQWGILTVLAKLGSSEMVGLYSLGLAVTAPVAMFADLGLREVQATDANNQYRFGDFLGVRILTSLFVIVSAILLSFFLGDTLEIRIVVIFMGLYKAIDSIKDIFMGHLQKHERMDFVAIAIILKGLLTLSVFTLLILISESLIIGISGMIVSLVLTFFVDIGFVNTIVNPGHKSLANLIDFATPYFDKAIIIPLVWSVLPLGLVNLLISLRVNIPRYFLDAHWGLSEFGIYSALIYIQIAGTQVFHAIGRSTSPRLAKYYKENKLYAFFRLFLKQVGFSLSAIMLGLLFVWVFGEQVLTLIYTQEYAQYVDMFMWILIGGGFIYIGILFIYAMTAINMYKIQAWLFVFVTSFTLIASYLFVPELGISGAVIALIISGGTQVILSIILFLTKIKQDSKKSAQNV